MLDCDWGSSEGPFVCIKCGAVRSKPINRNCDKINKEMKNIQNECPCSTPGYCEEYGIELTGRLWDICRGYDNSRREVLTFERREKYRQEWKRLKEEKEKTYCQWEDLGENDVKCADCGIVLPKNEYDAKRICPNKAGSQGLGDLAAKALKAVGIEQKEGCGCGQRQEALNKLVPFKKKDNQ